jgi:hypothetical protein
MFCATQLVFGGTVGVGFRFHFFLHPDSFSAVSRAFNPVFMISALGHVFGGTEGVKSRFHILHYRTCFRRYRGRRVPFSCFALPDTFTAVPRALCPFFMFCGPEPIFEGTGGVGSRFHILRDRTHFRRYRGRQVMFSCFMLPNSFSVVPWASGPVFMFSAPEHVFDGTEGVCSRFHVLRSRTRFRRYRGRQVPFSCFVLPYSFSSVPRVSGPVFMFCAP